MSLRVLPLLGSHETAPPGGLRRILQEIIRIPLTRSGARAPRTVAVSRSHMPRRKRTVERHRGR